MLDRMAIVGLCSDRSRRSGLARVKGQDGAVAEWLRSGLQSREHQFDSGPRLHPLVLTG